jgi:Na+/melibiose symporter-like transporter
MIKSSKSGEALTRGSLFRYGIIALPLAFAGLPLYIYAPDFYARDLGLDLALMGVILLCIRLFDAVQDPFIGWLGDRYHHYAGIIIGAGLLTLTIGLGMIFYGPQGDVLLPLWFGLGMVFATTGFSLLSITVNTVGGLWSDNHHQKTRITSWREGFMLVGLLCATILPAWLQTEISVARSLEITFIVFACLVIAAALLFMIFLKQDYVERREPNAQRIAYMWVFIKSLDRQNIYFYAAYFFAQLASSIPAILVLFFIKDYLKLPDSMGIFLFLYFLSGIGMMWFWLTLSKRIGKVDAWFFSMMLAVMTFAFAVTLNAGDMLAYAIICVTSGMALGANLSLPPAILADYIQDKKDESQAGQYFACLTVIPKITMALGSGMAFLALDYSGFATDSDNTDQAKGSLLLLYALVPCILQLVAMGVTYKLIKDDKV